MNATRQELLRLLSEIGVLYPEMRLGQLLDWLATAAKGETPEAVYDVDDAELIAAIRDHIANPLARCASGDEHDLGPGHVSGDDVLRDMEGS